MISRNSRQHKIRPRTCRRWIRNYICTCTEFGRNRRWYGSASSKCDIQCQRHRYCECDGCTSFVLSNVDHSIRRFWKMIQFFSLSTFGNRSMFEGGNIIHMWTYAMRILVLAVDDPGRYFYIVFHTWTGSSSLPLPLLKHFLHRSQNSAHLLVDVRTKCWHDHV